MKRLKLWLLVVLTALIFQPLFADTAEVIRIEATLSDRSTGLLEGSRSVVVNLVDASDTVLWTETHTVLFTQGNMAVNLGSTEPFTKDLFDTDRLRFEFEVDGSTIEFPEITYAIPFAYKAKFVESVSSDDLDSSFDIGNVAGSLVITQFPDGLITGAKIQDGAITDDHIGGSISASKISGLTTALIGTDVITSDNIVNGSIASVDMSVDVYPNIIGLGELETRLTLNAGIDIDGDVIVNSLPALVALSGTSMVVVWDSATGAVSVMDITSWDSWDQDASDDLLISTLTGGTGMLLQVNAAETGFDFVDPSTLAGSVDDSTFLVTDADRTVLSGTDISFASGSSLTIDSGASLSVDGDLTVSNISTTATDSDSVLVLEGNEFKTLDTSTWDKDNSDDVTSIFDLTDTPSALSPAEITTHTGHVLVLQSDGSFALASQPSFTDAATLDSLDSTDFLRSNASGTFGNSSDAGNTTLTMLPRAVIDVAAGATLEINGNLNFRTDYALPIANGGTGALTVADARTNLGLGTLALQAADSVAITGGDIDGVDLGQTTAITSLQMGGDITFTGTETVDGVDISDFVSRLNSTVTVTDAETFVHTSRLTGLSELAEDIFETTLVLGNNEFIVRDSAGQLDNQPISDLGLDLVSAADQAEAFTDLGLGSMANQDNDAVDIDGGAIDGVALGQNAAITSLEMGGNITFTGTETVDGVDVSALNTSFTTLDSELAAGTAQRVHYNALSDLPASIAFLDGITIASDVQALLQAADDEAFRTELGLGSAALSDATAFQSADATLTSIAALGTQGNRILYTTDADVFAEAALSNYARQNILNLTDQTALQTLIGLGSLGTQAANAVDIDGGAIDGVALGQNTAITSLEMGGNITFTGTETVDGVDVSVLNTSFTTFQTNLASAGDGALVHFDKITGEPTFVFHSGTPVQNRLARIDSSTGTIANSVLRDNGSTLALGTDPEANKLFTISESSGTDVAIQLLGENTGVFDNRFGAKIEFGDDGNVFIQESQNNVLLLQSSSQVNLRADNDGGVANVTIEADGGTVGNTVTLRAERSGSQMSQIEVEDNGQIVVEGNIASGFAFDLKNLNGNATQGVAVRLGQDVDDDSAEFISFYEDASALSGGTKIGRIMTNADGDGVVFSASGADYAEYMKRRDVSERIEAADIVGVHHGEISKTTSGAQRVMVVSSKPVVLGNWKGDGSEKEMNPVAFVGQVPVKVRGSVNAGDYIVPSGANDGFGVAVSAADIRPEQLAQVVGQAWETVSAETGIVNVALLAGDASAALGQVVKEHAELKRENATLRQEIDDLRKAVEAIQTSLR